MCTAMTFNADSFYFGRTLDYDLNYDNGIVIIPRECSIEFSNSLTVKTHSAIMGSGIIVDNFPLMFEGVNESGLCVAALSFKGDAIYDKPQENKENIASFEFIPYILSTCVSVSGAHTKLLNANITDTAFNGELPASPLHFIIADKKDCITVESTKDGLKVYENPVGVLTNSPAFDMQLFNLNNYAFLSVYNSQNKMFGGFEAKNYSRGMGALGLPGDFSSASRFVRATFVKNHLLYKEDNVGQFFHALDSVSVPSGIVVCENGREQETQYACCIDTVKGIYYYVTKENRQICAVALQNENLDGSRIITYPFIKTQKINRQN